jgi:hypothetical protein
MAGVQARLRTEYQRKYPELSSSVWYEVVPIFPGVTQRMVNMAGERLTRLMTPRGFVILRAEHLEFRPETKGTVEPRPAAEPTSSGEPESEALA